MSVSPNQATPLPNVERKADGAGHGAEISEHLMSALDLIDAGHGSKEAAAYIQMALDAMAEAANGKA